MIFAWLFHYPGQSEEPPLEEAREDLPPAGEVYEAALIRLLEEVWP